MALVKDTFCKFRLSSDQKAKIKQMAADRGLSEGELILVALVLEGDGEASSLPAVTTPERPDPKKEPGAAALLEVADRVQSKRRRKS